MLRCFRQLRSLGSNGVTLGDDGCQYLPSAWLLSTMSISTLTLVISAGYPVSAPSAHAPFAWRLRAVA